MLINGAVTAQLICAFVFAYAKGRFSHERAYFKISLVTGSPPSMYKEIHSFDVVEAVLNVLNDKPRSCPWVKCSVPLLT